MPATTLTLALILQTVSVGNPTAHGGPGAVPEGPGAAVSIPVAGTVEVDAVMARDTADEAVERWVRERWDGKLVGEVEAATPFWLPDSLVHRMARRSVGSWPVAELVSVVDEAVETRQHEFGTSYRSVLTVRENRNATVRMERRLANAVRAAEQRVLATAGGTVVLWAVLFLILSWLDRLSRGYMTGRLATIGLLAGSGIPAAAVLL